MHDKNKLALARIFKIFVPLFSSYRFTTYQDARRVRLVDGLETNILRVSPVNFLETVRIFTVPNLSYLFGMISEFRLCAIFDGARLLEQN